MSFLVASLSVRWGPTTRHHKTPCHTAASCQAHCHPNKLDRDALFSLAISSIVARLLPAIFLDLREHEEAVMASIDVKAAFLTVDQDTPTVVKCQLADGQTMDYSSGKVLAGQRDGIVFFLCNYWFVEVRAFYD